MTVTFERPRRPIRTDPSFIRRIDYPFMKNILKFTESENLHGFFLSDFGFGTPFRTFIEWKKIRQKDVYNSIGIS